MNKLLMIIVANIRQNGLILKNSKVKTKYYILKKCLNTYNIRLDIRWMNLYVLYLYLKTMEMKEKIYYHGMHVYKKIILF